MVRAIFGSEYRSEMGRFGQVPVGTRELETRRGCEEGDPGGSSQVNQYGGAVKARLNS
jgi:hypothetical protein